MEQHTNKGQTIVELLVGFGLASILLPAIISGFVSSSNGKVQQQQRLVATGYLEEGVEGIRSVREAAWGNIINNNTYHLVSGGTGWTIQDGPETLGDFTRSIVISDVTPYDPSVKKVTVTVSWNNIIPSSVSSIFYLTRYLNDKIYTQTTQADFTAGTLNNVQVTNVSGGEVKLANNNKAKWCSPELSAATIDLPDGPPVAVAAFANATNSNIPNDVFVAVAPTAATLTKLAYLNVSANTDPPVPQLKGTFTLEPSKYSAPGLVPTGINLTNNFKTNDVKYYTSASGKVYALLATDLPDHEVVVVQVFDGVADSYQDPVNKIYKYWTFFNTRQYQGDSRSTPNQDSAPFGYGGVSLAVSGTRGYVLSGGYLYAFDLSNIDSKTSGSGLDMLGCRVQLDGYDCQPGSGTDRKYDAGQTGSSWSDTTSPAHLNCSDGGNIELYADNHMSVISVSGSTYVYVAVGAGTNPELDIVNVTNVPTSSTNPKINNSSCGRISGGASGWKRVGSLDFNNASGTEEAANSVYAKSDGTRAYISSNGGIDGNNDGHPDSHQFYIINTSNKSSPSIVSGGYYDGNSTNIQLFPRRSLTVLNGGRAIIVGKDGVADGVEPKEYQVVNIENEGAPAYCGGINFLAGFNDLTSVSEADGDNFVYMVANTTEKQLKIVQGGPDSGIYVDSGIFTSNPFSIATPSAFNRFVANVVQPANTTIKMQVAVATPSAGLCVSSNFNYVGPGGDPAAFYTPLGASISASFPLGLFGNYQNPERCFGYKTFLNTTDYNQTPVLNDMIINYSP
jgi:type II secretory pathway pseudopilin PulG